MQRRSLLKLGLGSAALLAVAGGGLNLIQPGIVTGHLAVEARAVFHAVAKAVLDGSLPTDAVLRDAALTAHLGRVDRTLAAFPVTTQAELSRLLSLLASTPGRLGIAGLYTPWRTAGVLELQESLQSMRTSSVTLRQQAYHALRDLTNAAYYSEPSTWSIMGYPGPRNI